MKKRLFTPGPTPVTEHVMLKMAEPIILDRNPEFNEVLTRGNQQLKYLFQTEQPVLTLTSSGTGGVESTFVSLFRPVTLLFPLAAENLGRDGLRCRKRTV